MSNTTTVYPAELEATQIMVIFRGEISTDDRIKEDANFILDLADRIKRQRLEGASK